MYFVDGPHDGEHHEVDPGQQTYNIVEKPKPRISTKAERDALYLSPLRYKMHRYVRRTAMAPDGDTVDVMVFDRTSE